MKRWRLIPPKEYEPSLNMAIDEALFKEYAEGNSPPTIRFYTWKPDGISIGCFQEPQEILNIKKLKDKNITFVRRVTGGEAIFHGRDLSYSAVLSEKDLELPRSVKESFKVLTSFIINAYNSLGLKAGYFSEAEDKESSSSSLCFAKKRNFDIKIDGKKIGGNAQKRNKSMIFQQGSIPLYFNLDEINEFFTEELDCKRENITSLSQALGRSLSFNEVSNMLKDAFSETFKVTLDEEDLTEKEKIKAKILREEKYENDNWNYFKKKA